ncbi:unnamed protein product [Arctia plantaginis]|uniref:Uncharacterized protein n=1 Tax=Arctia plantaginis TaxID=874455 RepID=A0A8S1AMJ0_ARCPL|nr:unnamed protein product [Arctia plantaginis]
MSEEMAVSDNTTGEETNMNGEETASAMIAEPVQAAPELLEEPEVPAPEESPPSADSPPPEVDPEEQGEPAEPVVAVKEELQSDEIDLPVDAIKQELDNDIKTEQDYLPNETDLWEENGEDKDDKKGIKRRASAAFSDTADEEFKGFFDVKAEIKTEDYSRVLERLEAEVTAATKAFIPLKTVMATPPAPTRASKRARKDTGSSGRVEGRRTRNSEATVML